MIKFESFTLPAADLGEQNPLPDIKNVSYIHADYELTSAIDEQEKRHIGKGMIPTLIPYRTQDGYNRDKRMRSFRTAVLENDHIRAIFVPELGGRLWSLYDKDLERELLYVNPVFQPGNLALRNAWFSGGVEFNVGIKGHTPLTCSPMYVSVDETDTGEVLRLYEYERIRGVVYSISAWLPDDANTLYIRCRIENADDAWKDMYWWSNIAVPETPNTRVIVPSREAFRCFYNADHYVLDKQTIPYQDDTDVSFPANIPSSRDFFYKLPETSSKWIAATERDGKGLLQCSTARLIGRKLFVWGQSTGGRHWNEWLSEKGSSYIEIQAGLAHTQLEHIPMPARTTWEWVEAYTALDCDPNKLYGDYNGAINTVNDYVKKRVGDPNALTFPTDNSIRHSRSISVGSGWGTLEELSRGERISSLVFSNKTDPEIAPWLQLLEHGTFPCPDPNDPPVSYVRGAAWADRLRTLPKQTWHSQLHLGVILYAEGDLDGARKAWESSVSLCPSAWGYRNLAMLHKNELNDVKTGAELLLTAFSLKPNCRALCVEVASLLTESGRDEEWLSLYETLSDSLKANSRLRLFRAIALIHTDRPEQAAEIVNQNFILPDIKEGELSVSAVWFDLYRRLYAKECGVIYDPNNAKLIAAADEKYPLPRSLDFRMH